MNEKNLKTRHIFIDTSIFVGANFNYESRIFRRLVSLTKSESVFIHLTPITINEIKSNINENVNKALQAFRKFQKDARILRNLQASPVKGLFFDIDNQFVRDSLLKQFEGFLKEASVDVIPTDSVSVDQVFELYFSLKPPFGIAKKKNEFPDAFTLVALSKWCAENDESIYVISTDTDMDAFCHENIQLISVQKLEEVVDLITLNDEKLSPFAYELLRNNLKKVEEKIKDEFENEAFWLEDRDGEAENVSVQSLEVGEIFLLEVTNDYAIFELTVSVDFSADISYEDYDTAIYDSEEGVLIPWETIDQTIERSVELPVEIRISFDIEKPEIFIIEKSSINTSDRYGIPIVVNNEWPYK